MKLLHNFYQVAGPCASHHFDATAYLLKDAKGYLMIDCGTVEGFLQVEANIRSLGIDPNQIHTILATHGHYDHVGAGHLWKQKYGTRLLIHPVDRQQVETADPELTSASLLYGIDPAPISVDGLLEEGDIIPVEGGTLEVLHTPGHTLGSVCFHLMLAGYSILIAGDTIWGGFNEKIRSDEAQWKISLEKITARHYDFYTFGHIGPQLLADADKRLLDAKKQFANYYNPWFKRFDEKYIF